MRLLRVWCALACAGALLAVPGNALATDSPKPGSVDGVVARTQADLAESTAALLDATVALRRAEAQLPQAQAEVARTLAALATAQRAVAVAAQQRGNAQTQLMLATQASETTSDVVADQRARIGRMVRQAYQSGGTLSEFSAVLDAESPADFAQRVMTMRSVSRAQESTLLGLRSLQAAIDHDAVGLSTLRSTLAVAQSTAEAELGRVASAARSAQLAERTLHAIVAARTSALAAAQAALAQDEAQRVVQQGVSSRLQTLLGQQSRALLGAAGSRAGASYPPIPGTLAWPANGPITSPFGMRRHPITGVYKLHTGADIGIPCGTVVHAARGGTVLQAYNDPAYGFRTVVVHGVVGGALLTTTYNHQSRIDVQVGQTVAVGQPIGLSGTTGYSTGCHLHFELIVNSDFVDPIPWL